MIQTRVEYRGAATANAIDFVDTYAVVCFALFRQSYNKVRPDTLRKLRFYPPPPPDSKYKRTGKYKDGWAVILEQYEDGGAVKIRNSVHYAKWVGGSFSRSQDFQQPQHTRTGWPRVRDVADESQSALLDDFAQRRNKYLDDRFGVTTGTRNR